MSQEDNDQLPATRKAPVPVTEADVAALTGLRLPRHQRFVAFYCAGATAAEAMVAINSRTHNPAQSARQLLRKPAIAQAVKTIREAMAKRAQYGQDDLVGELDAAAGFARETKNATAYVRAIELKGKALGLLVDRVDARVQQVPFRIEIETGT